MSNIIPFPGVVEIDTGGQEMVSTRMALPWGDVEVIAPKSAGFTFTDDRVICEFFVRGKPEPAGSKKAVPLRGQKGARPIVVDANKHAAGWKKTVANVAAYNYLGQPVDEPIALELVFVVARPQGHWLTNGALSAVGQRQSRPTAKPDALKLARAVEDALTGIVYTDDSRIIYGSQYKRYQRTRDEPLGVSVRVRRLL